MSSEPEYTYDGFALAGVHPRNGRTYRVTDTERVSITGLASMVGSTDVVALPERETLAVAVDMVRRILDVGTMSARELLPIVRHTAAMIRDPRETVYRSAAMSLGIGSGDVDAVMSSADPWGARQHETKITRSRKGRTSFKRTRVAMAPVIGDHHAPTSVTDDAITDEACQARDRAALSLMGARRLRLGWNALDVQRATDQHYRALGLAPLAGSDATSWARTTNGDRTSRASVASHRSGIDGTASRSTVNVVAAYGNEYASHTATVAVWPVRGDQTTGHKATTYKRNGTVDQGFALPMGHVRSGDPTDARMFVVAPDGETTLTWSLIAPNDRPTVRTEIVHNVKRGPRVIVKRSSLRTLPARQWTVRDNVVQSTPRSNASMELERLNGRNATARDAVTRWQGHTVVKRADVKRAARKTNDKRRQAIDIGKIAAPASAPGWREVLANLNRGEKLTATSDDGPVTITRNTQCYVATDRRGDEPITWRKRSAESLAEHLATA